jgi:flagella basal body P-ring formation protein FlgA
VAPEDIIEAARRHLRAQFRDGGSEVRIELLSEAPEVLVCADDEPVELRASLPASGAPIGTVRVDVELLRGGARLKNIPLSFTVKVREEVAIAAVNIGTGERLSDANVAFAVRDVGTVRGACFRDADAMVGKVAARPIRPGQVITDRLIEDAPKPQVIAANQLVYVVVQTPTLRIAAVGKALTSARAGDVVTARNVATRKEMTGIAQPDSSIRVLMEGQTDDALQTRRTR